MTGPLSTLVEEVEASSQTLSIVNYGGSEAATDRIVSYFEPQHVAVRDGVSAPSLPADFAVLHDGDSFVAAAAVADIDCHLSGESYLEDGGFGFAERPAILRHVDDRTFTSYDRRRMTLASREIESYAYHAGGGEIHAGFQRFSILRPQTRIYERIDEAGVDVHAYGAPDANAPEPVVAHPSEDAEILGSWFVVYEGDGPGDARALVAVETDAGAGEFSGFWTYETETVETVLERLRAEYPATTDAPAPTGD
ncbi:hypothetical protein NDI76_11605 [Halogeometricum sp. S1BR25-6]|uniref:DICT domain-containing protein n=1 Tax=Halogeometricum salsisoli TaxID=2950536 RepID=A0ABU2GF06_9EURY|nr:DICT sensory domain-containing protein [Halogeometricum sp. S1BR25-6]MDS0299387.1 hypothetical protein [Halogeometricum sp. S1BR25-6]